MSINISTLVRVMPILALLTPFAGALPTASAGQSASNILTDTTSAVATSSTDITCFGDAPVAVCCSLFAMASFRPSTGFGCECSLQSYGSWSLEDSSTHSWLSSAIVDMYSVFWIEHFALQWLIILTRQVVTRRRKCDWWDLCRRNVCCLLWGSQLERILE